MLYLSIEFNNIKDMKRISITLLSLIMPLLMMAQGWPAN